MDQDNNGVIEDHDVTVRRWTQVPFDPAKFPFFYGWVIVAIASLSIVCSLPGQTASVGVYTEHLIEALRINREQLSRAYLMGTLCSAMLLPYAGKLLDRVGVRVMGVFAAVGLALSLLVFSNVGTVRDVVFPTAENVWVPIIIAAFAFMLIRFFGQGNMTMVGRVAMGKWFNHRRGMATAISGVVVSFAFNAAPYLLNKLILIFQWRQSCWFLAAIIGVGMAVLAWVFFRDKPEDCGLVMDGVTDQNWRARKAKMVPEIYQEFTRGQATRTITFWAFSVGLSFWSLVITAVSFHIPSISAEIDKPLDQVVRFFFYSTFFSIGSRFFVSYLVDNTKVKLKWVLLLMHLTMVVGTCGIATIQTRLGWYMTIVGLGITSGIWGVLLNVSFPRFFGREHLGAISGLNMTVTVVASAIGPWLFDMAHRLTGSYRHVALWSLLVLGLIAIPAFFVVNPQREYAGRIDEKF